MFINCSNNVQKFGNLKPLFRTKTVECLSSILYNKQQIRLSSSNDGDTINDEQFDNHTTSTTKTNRNENKESNSSSSNLQQSTAAQKSSNHKNVNSKMFIEVNLFGPKDARLNLPGNTGFAPPKYLNKIEKKKIKKELEKEFKLISDHNPLMKECLTTTIEFNLNNYETNEDRQNRVIENLIFNHKDDQSLERNESKFKNLFFVKVYKSTELILNDLKHLFPKDFIFEKEFVIITIYKNPFTKLTNVNLKEEFVNLANCIAESLNKNGFWANFLEPDGKRSYADLITCLNINSDQTRFINYGVEIEDHADCKFINHVNNAALFIGSVFTNARLDSIELNRILSLLTKF